MTGFSNVAVLCGGVSRERDISLQSGAAVAEGLKQAGVNAVLIDTADEAVEFKSYDAVFVALHGRDGEDGKIQAVLDYHKIPYTGSGVAASAVSMNKWYTKAVWQSVGIPTPDYWLIKAGEPQTELDIDMPVYVKPVNEGSSIGITHVTEPPALYDAIEHAATFDSFIVVEQQVTGKEYTYSFIEGQSEMSLICLEPAVDFYDYDAKYLRDDTKYVLDPPMDKDVRETCIDYARRAYEVLGLRGWGRVDFIVDEDNRPWFIEVNSVPGMTSHSLVPMAAGSIGLGFSDTCMAILENVRYG